MQKVIPVEDSVLRDTFWNAAIDLKKENDQLKSRIKRMEDAGDYLCASAAFMGWHDKIDAWNKAKEAKP
jgi:hypothetical protein